MECKDPVIEKFITEYALSNEFISLETWALKYAVCRQTIAKWIKEYNTDIEELTKERITEFNKNLQSVGEKALSDINNALDGNDRDVACKVMQYVAPKKEQITADVKINEPDKWVLDLENANIGGK